MSDQYSYRLLISILAHKYKFTNNSLYPYKWSERSVKEKKCSLCEHKSKHSQLSKLHDCQDKRVWFCISSHAICYYLPSFILKDYW